jgi:hypothetical protein
MEAHPQIPEKTGWYWVLGSVEYNQIEDRYRYYALHGPGFELVRGGAYARVLIDLYGTVVDVSVVKGEKRRVCMPLPRELNHIWAPLYGGCHIAYIVSKRLFLLLTDQLVGDWANIYIHRRGINVRLQP